MTKTQKLITLPVLGILLLAGGGIAGYAGIVSAQEATGMGSSTTMQRHAKIPHVDGAITAISGPTITISADAKHGAGTYAIDTSGATFTKAGAAASISSFAVGEKVWAAGTISGTNVVATSVTDKPAFGERGRGGRGGHGKGPSVHGTVSAVNGTTVTVTGMDGKSYTVNAGSATVQRFVTGSLSDITVGDTIGVHGTVSGTNVTATTIMDSIPNMGR